MVIVDTTVWIDYLRGSHNPQTDWLENELTRRRLALTDLILCEVLQGVRGDDDYIQVRNHLLKFHVFTTADIKLAGRAAENYRELRRRGRTVRKTIDGLIATFCMQNNHFLLHRDRDFDQFENELDLKVIHA